MMIVVEGPDNSGKSTLARTLADRLNFGIISSEGPPKYPGEIDERVKRYAAIADQRYIFDRHPCVSNPIYDTFRSNAIGVSSHLIDDFYSMKPHFIYCRATQGLSNHVVKPHDSQAHLELVNKNELDIIELYDKWALNYANAIYRIGDRVEPLVRSLL